MNLLIWDHKSTIKIICSDLSCNTGQVVNKLNSVGQSFKARFAHCA